MSELQSYYDTFRCGYWACENENDCPCHGSGWALSDVDTWHECPIHFHGQMHPEAIDGYVNENGKIDSEAFEAAQHLSLVEWAVKRNRASFTKDEQARRAPVPVPAVSRDDNEIPF